MPIFFVEPVMKMLTETSIFCFLTFYFTHLFKKWRMNCAIEQIRYTFDQIFLHFLPQGMCFSQTHKPQGTSTDSSWGSNPLLYVWSTQQWQWWSPFWQPSYFWDKHALASYKDYMIPWFFHGGSRSFSWLLHSDTWWTWPLLLLQFSNELTRQAEVG